MSLPCARPCLARRPSPPGQTRSPRNPTDSPSTRGRYGFGTRRRCRDSFQRSHWMGINSSSPSALQTRNVPNGLRALMSSASRSVGRFSSLSTQGAGCSSRQAANRSTSVCAPTTMCADWFGSIYLSTTRVLHGTSVGCGTWATEARCSSRIYRSSSFHLKSPTMSSGGLRIRRRSSGRACRRGSCSRHRVEASIGIRPITSTGPAWSSPIFADTRFSSTGTVRLGIARSLCWV